MARCGDGAEDQEAPHGDNPIQVRTSVLEEPDSSSHGSPFSTPQTWNESGGIYVIVRRICCGATSHLVQRRLAAVVAGVRVRVHRQQYLRRCAVPLGTRLVQRRRAAFVHLLRKQTHLSAEKPLLCGFGHEARPASGFSMRGGLPLPRPLVSI